ncbi:hypothetical protein DUHN55_46970 [Helicobacter pylori]
MLATERANGISPRARAVAAVAAARRDGLTGRDAAAAPPTSDDSPYSFDPYEV